MNNKYFKVTFEALDPVSNIKYIHTPVYNAKTSEDAVKECLEQIYLYGFFKEFKMNTVVEIK